MINLKGKKIITFTGPSGAGKDTVGGRAMQLLGIKEIVSTTTRKPRAGEIEGISYYFLDKSEAKPEKFAEYVEYSGNAYGLTKAEIESKLSESDFAFCIVEVEGLKQLKNLYGEDMIISFFINLPGDSDEENLSIMRDRMLSRGDDQDKVNQRIQNAIDTNELHNYKHCRYNVANSDVDKAVKEIIRTLVNNYSISQKIAS